MAGAVWTWRCSNCGRLEVTESLSKGVSPSPPYAIRDCGHCPDGSMHMWFVEDKK